MQDTRFDIEHVLLSYYIRYEAMEQLILEIANSPYGNVNDVDIYIDLYNFTSPLYKTNVFSKNQFTIVSSVINLAAHMRRFFWTRYGIRTNIYLVYGSDIADNHRRFCPGFGNSSVTQTMNFYQVNQIIESQMDMIKILCGYIDGVYFIRKSTDFCMFTYDNILKSNKVSIVLTKDKYAYLIPSMIDRAFLFRPKKNNGLDNSFVVSHRNVLSKYYDKATNNIDVLNKMMMLDTGLLSLMIPLSGIIEKGLRSIISYTTTISKVYNAVIERQVMANGHNIDFRYVYNQLDLSSKLSLDEFANRFQAIDLYYQNLLYCNSVEANDISWLVDLSDKRSLYEINNKYFIDNPLDLASLFLY